MLQFGAARRATYDVQRIHRNHRTGRGNGTLPTALKSPGANGKGKSKDEALEGLADTIALILEDRREGGIARSPLPPHERLSEKP